MPNLLKYSSNYSDATCSLWFYSKDEITNFNANIKDNNAVKSFKYKAKLLGKIEADGTNGILRNTAITVLLKHLSNLSNLMLLINCKVELKLKWTNHCILSVNGNDNNDANSSNISFTIKGTKLYVPVVTLSAKGDQKRSKLLSKGFERSLYWNKYKTKSVNKNTANEYRYFLELNFAGVNRLFVLVH